MALPDPINHQDFLLTLDTSTLPVVKDALPGVDIWPLFLDAENGLWVIRAQFQPGVTLPSHFHTGTVLAAATVRGTANNVPSATGASRPAVLGKIIPGTNRT